MTGPAWSEIKEILHGRRSGANMLAADEFWSDFRARARLRRQSLPAPARPAFVSPAWALASACAVVVLAWIGFMAFRGADAAAQECVKSFTVTAPHGAVIMLEDEATQCTVLWVVDMEA